MSNSLRKAFSTNPFERKILLVVFVSTGIPVFVVILFFYLLFYDVIYGYIQSGLADHFIKDFLVVAIIVLLAYFAIVGIIAYRFIHSVFGSYPRIANELDEIVSGKAKKHIHLRLGDYGKDIVQRINKLIDKLP